MATVLRLKRSFSEDPVDGILLCSKRLKSNEGDYYEETRKYFAFIGSINDENKEKEKDIISRVFTGDSSLSKYSGDARKSVKRRSVNITAKVRTERREKSQENRLKLISSLREHPPETESSENQSVLDDAAKDLYKLYDVIEETSQQETDENTCRSGITCNGVALVKTNNVQSSTYDLYYASGDEVSDVFVENVVSIEKCSMEEQEGNLDMQSESEDESEEDSNDENNWRNDYPDEDDDFEKEIDYYADYDDDEEEILNMIESCNVRDDIYGSDDSSGPEFPNNLR